MRSRSEILDRISKCSSPDRPSAPMPDMEPLYQAKSTTKSLLEDFIQSARQQGAEVAFSQDISDPAKWISGLYPEAENIYSTIAGGMFPSNVADQAGRPDLRQLDISIIQGGFGVAENGSIWIPESSLSIRVIPFICEHLVIMLDEKKIVSNMHAAYRATRLEKTGYGLFIAGPSKTADIEQSLVIGAQGARSVMILFGEMDDYPSS